MTKLDLIRLGEQLAQEQAAALDLWSWLPSYKIAERYHGAHALEHCPNNADVMVEAAMYFGYLKHPDFGLSGFLYPGRRA